MKLHKIPASILIAGLMVSMVLMTACDDERTPPSTAPDTTYSETIILFENETAAGQKLSKSFELLDSIKDGFIRITCYFDPDTDMANFEQYGSEVDSITAIIDEVLNVDISKLGLEIVGFPARLNGIVADTVSLGVDIDTLGTAIDSLDAIDPLDAEQDSILSSWQLQLVDLQDQKDSLIVLYDSLLIRKEVIPVEREVYRVQKALNEALLNEREANRDLLDIILDNRFKLSVALDDDSIEYYPEAIFIIDSVEVDTNLFALDTTFYNPIDGSVRAGAILDPNTIDPTHLDQALYDSLSDVLAGLTPILDGVRADIDNAKANWDSLRASIPDDSVLVWGQGIFQTPYPDKEYDARGITFQLDLDEFWVADSGWSIGEPFIHSERPERGVSWTNQFPMREFKARLNSGRSHTLHFRVGAEGTDTRITTSLYAGYYNKVVR